eukprot:jgi/Psemu1/36759/gm1.36759_g
MKLNPICSTLLGIIQLASASPADQQQQQQQQHEVRRKLTEDETECVLYLRVGDDDESWTCRFTEEQTEKLGIPDTMEIEGVPKDFFDSSKIVSGGTIMKVAADGAFVRQPYATRNYHAKIVVSKVESITIENLPRDDPRHYLNNFKTKGTFKTLVVRVIDQLGQETDIVDVLRSEIFQDQFNMKTQLAACSKGQMLVKEAGFENLAVDLISSISMDQYLFGDACKAAAEKQWPNIGTEYDLVMFCFPPGIVMGGHANIHTWDSYYGHPWCSLPSMQIHEIGHNLGLGHSMKDGDEYGDRSSFMGTGGPPQDDGPHQCFNPADNYKLGWYENQQLSIKPMELSGPQTFVLNGVDDYKMDGSSNGELIVLRLVFYGDFNAWDYYVGYNRASGVNRGTGEAADTVTVMLKLNGGPYGYSNSERFNVNVGDTFNIVTEESTPDVYIEFQSIQNGGKDAIVVISNSGGVGPNPTPTPKPNPTPATPEPTPLWTSTSSSSSTMNCEDDSDFKFKGKRKHNCKWVGKGKGNLNKKKTKKIQKKCKKKVNKKEKIWDYCRETCALVDMGPCA